MAQSLDNFYHESLKKWLKGKCSFQAAAVTNSFESAGIKASYDPKKEIFIIHPSEKEFSREEVESTFDNEEEFNLLVAKMQEP